MAPFRGIAHTHTLCVCSSALTASSARSALAGPRDRLGHPDTAYHKSASQSLKHGLADALKYILEWAAAVCTAIPHLSVQFVQSLADAIEYNWEWAAAVCTAVPHLSVQFVLSLDHFSVPSVLPRRDRFGHLNTALS